MHHIDLNVLVIIILCLNGIIFTMGIILVVILLQDLRIGGRKIWDQKGPHLRR